MTSRYASMLRCVVPAVLLATSVAVGGEAAQGRQIRERGRAPHRAGRRFASDRDGYSGRRGRLAQNRDRDRDRGRRFGADRSSVRRRRRGVADSPGQGPFAEEQLERAMAFLNEHLPERHRQLMLLRENSPDMFRRRIGRMLPRVLRIMERFDRNPEAGELMLQEDRLEVQINKLVEQFFDTEDHARADDIRRQLRRLVTERFDVRQRLREMEVHRLERRLDAIRVQLQRNAEHREERIGQALEELGIIED